MKLSRLKIYTKQASMMIRDVMIYRADFMSRYVSTIVRFMIAAFLWLAIIKSGDGEVAGYDVPGIMTYFLLMQIITGFVFSAAMSGFRIAEMIQSGDLSTKIIQPVDILKLIFSMDFGRGLFFFTSSLVIIGTIALIFNDFFNLSFNPIFILLGVLGMISAFILNFTIVVMIGMSAFWITSSHRLIFHFFAILQLLSGMMVPLDFFPDAIKNILLNTPFPSIAYFPIRLVQANSWTPELTHMSIVAGVYLVILVSMMYGLFNIGLKKYEAVGR